MRDYIKTKTIEEAKRQIESGFATKEQIEQWTADPPILPSWKVVELELQDVPEFLDNNGIIYHDCKLKWRDGGDTLTDETGEKFRFHIPFEVGQEVRAEVKRRHRTAYDAEVKAKADKMRADLLDGLKDSPDIKQGRRIAIERLERILEGRDTEGLTPAETNLRTAWQDIAIGSPYMGGQYDINKRKRFSLAAVPYPSKVVLGLEADFMQIDNPLRRVYTEAKATHITLQWLRDTPAEQLFWDNTVRADFASLWAENVRDIVRHFSTPESAEVQVFKRPNRQALETIEQDLAENPATTWRTMGLIEHSSRGEATRAELERLLKGKLEASADYHTPRKFAAALLAELEGLLQRHSNLLDSIGGTAKPLAIAEDWKDHLKAVSEATEQPAPVADMTAGQAFAFTAEGKLIEKPTFQAIVEYFNEKGAEVKLFTTGNDLALQSLDETELEAYARYEVDTSELPALFNAKLKAAKDSGKVTSPQAFAKAECKRLLRAWADYTDRFPIVGQWVEHLERMASEAATDSPEQTAQTDTPPQGRKASTEAESEPKLTQRQAAYLLAYQNAGIQDPRSDPNRLAHKWAKQLCRKYSPTTGDQLYERFDELRSKSDRQRAFNTAFDRFSEKRNKRIVESLLTDIETIIPLLKGEQRTEAQNDLKRWNTAFQSEVN